MNKMQLTFIFFSSFVLFISPQTPAFSQSQFNFSPCEKWIIKQITRGDVADLIVEFQEERDRILSATFLEKLFTNDFKNL